MRLVSLTLLLLAVVLLLVHILQMRRRRVANGSSAGGSHGPAHLTPSHLLRHLVKLCAARILLVLLLLLYVRRVRLLLRARVASPAREGARVRHHLRLVRMMRGSGRAQVLRGTALLRR